MENNLSVLLENLRDEIDRWELADSSLDAQTVRYGLYLIAMDVLWCEVMTGHSYVDYLALQTSAKLPEADYLSFARQLAPFIEWLKQINLARISSFKDAGMTELQAQDELLSTHLTTCQEWLKTKPSTV